MTNIYDIINVEKIIARMIKSELKQKNQKTLDAYLAKTLERKINQDTNNAIMNMVECLSDKKRFTDVTKFENKISKMIKKDLKNKNQKTLDAYDAKTLERVFNQATNNVIMNMVDA
jgi:hypothetical protein